MKANLHINYAVSIARVKVKGSNSVGGALLGGAERHPRVHGRRGEGLHRQRQEVLTMEGPSKILLTSPKPPQTAGSGAARWR